MRKENKTTSIAGFILMIAFTLLGVNCAPNSDTTTTTGTAPAILYSGSPYVFFQNSMITTETPTLTGDTPVSCTASPALPAGLSINATSCAISGTPITLQGAASYTVTASNDTGSGTTNISIEVILPVAGTKFVLSTGGVAFKMIYVPGGLTPPTIATVTNEYTISETEVTYELWSTVYSWAIANGYTFANAGTMGDGTGDTNQHPVTTTTWRDAMVWCNALTEYFNAQNSTSYAVVYTNDAAYTTPIRSSADGAFGLGADYPNPGSFDDPYVNPNAKGFRLPTDAEWGLAASYKGSDSTNSAIENPAASGNWWTPGNYASGATADHTIFAATNLVAWFGGIADGIGGNTTSTQPVKTKVANALGLFDMSGNVWEWDFDWHPSFIGGSRVARGGSWFDGPLYLQVGHVDYNFPYFEANNIGFRLARTP